MIQTAQISVTTSATQLTSAVNTMTGSIAVYNRGSAAVYVGNGSGVTTGTGFQLDAGESITLDLNTGTGDAIWAIAGTGTQAVHVLRVGR